jgi:hypothetical protein
MDYVSPDTKNMTAVGYWVTKEILKDYQEMANELYSQAVPDGQGGMVPLIEKPDVNLFLNFCVSFYKQYKGLMNQMTQNPQTTAMIEGIVDQLARSGGLPQS